MISDVVICAMYGDLQNRLLPRHQVKGASEENRLLGADELARGAEMGIRAIRC